MKHKSNWPARVVLIAAIVAFGTVVAIDVTGQTPKTATSKPSFAAYLRTELFFGMDKPTGGVVSEDEWQRFVADIVTPRFPEGFTIDDALGQYLDGKILVREKSKQLILIYPRKYKTASSRRIEEIRAAYIKAFDQKSVLRVDLTTFVLVSF